MRDGGSAKIPVKKIVSIAVKAVLVAVMGALAAWGVVRRAVTMEKFDYGQVLDKEAFELDGSSYSFRDLAFFIARQEQVVEEEARIYNKKSTRDYWNVHTNGKFVSAAAKEAVLDMAVHDNLMYNLALENGVYLDADQLKEADNAILDFWMDLLDHQGERLLEYTTESAVNDMIRKKALAEVYQDRLAVENNHAYYYYDVGGDGYEEILKEHDLKVNKAQWKRFKLGEITIRHTRVNYAPGYDHD